MEQLIFGTVEIKMEHKDNKYNIQLTDDAMNTIEFKGLDYMASELLNRTVRNLNALAGNHDVATILAFERGGIDEIPDLIEEKDKDSESDADDDPWE
jgi:hypothetical protein